MDSFVRMIRRIFPSSTMISRGPLAMLPIAALDRLGDLPYREFDNLPPGRFRIRVGVGKKVAFNQAAFLRYGYTTWMEFFGEFIDLAADVVDLGCGCGRTALAVRDFPACRGHYTGVDVDEEMLAWCRRKFPPNLFTFLRVDARNTLYNPQGTDGRAPLAIADQSQDFVFSQALFTNILGDEVEHYVSETYRILKPQAFCSMGVFCLDDMREGGFLGGRWTFPFQIGAASVENLKCPEAAVTHLVHNLRWTAVLAAVA